MKWGTTVKKNHVGDSGDKPLCGKCLALCNTPGQFWTASNYSGNGVAVRLTATVLYPLSILVDSFLCSRGVATAKTAAATATRINVSKSRVTRAAIGAGWRQTVSVHKVLAFLIDSDQATSATSFVGDEAQSAAPVLNHRLPIEVALDDRRLFRVNAFVTNQVFNVVRHTVYGKKPPPRSSAVAFKPPQTFSISKKSWRVQKQQSRYHPTVSTSALHNTNMVTGTRAASHSDFKITGSNSAVNFITYGGSARAIYTAIARFFLKTVGQREDGRRVADTYVHLHFLVNRNIVAYLGGIMNQRNGVADIAVGLRAKELVGQLNVNVPHQFPAISIAIGTDHPVSATNVRRGDYHSENLFDRGVTREIHLFNSVVVTFRDTSRGRFCSTAPHYLIPILNRFDIDFHLNRVYCVAESVSCNPLSAAVKQIIGANYYLLALRFGDGPASSAVNADCPFAQAARELIRRLRANWIAGNYVLVNGACRADIGVVGTKRHNETKQNKPLLYNSGRLSYRRHTAVHEPMQKYARRGAKQYANSEFAEFLFAEEEEREEEEKEEEKEDKLNEKDREKKKHDDRCRQRRRSLAIIARKVAALLQNRRCRLCPQRLHCHDTDDGQCR